MSRYRTPDVSQFSRTVWLRPQGLPAILLVLGIALTCFLYLLSRSRDDRRVKEEFERAASNRVSTLRRIVERSVHALESLASFHEASHEVERQEFHDFVQPLLAHTPAIQALEWIPRIPRKERAAAEAAARADGLAGFEFTERAAEGGLTRAGDRDEYFPVYYVEPYEGNEAARGFDLGSHPTRREALRLARESGRLTASARVHLVQDRGPQFGFLLILPVHRKHAGATSPDVEGYVLGVFRAGDLLESGLAYLDRRGIEFCVIDRSAPEGQRFLHAISAAPSDGRFRPVGDIPPEGGLSITETIHIGGREWGVDCRPTAAYLAARRGAIPLLTLLGGILCSLLLSGCVLLIIFRADRTRRHALELLEAKHGLEREISDRLQAEERVTLLTRAIEQSTEGLAVADFDGNLLFVNPAFAEMHGYTVEELIGEKLAIFHSPEQMAAVDEANREVLENGEFSGEVWHLRRNGEVFPGEMNNTLLRDEAGAPLGVIGTLRDITRQKEIEEDLLKAEKLESVGQLAGGIAHDFNNLLTGILGNINLARVHSEEGTNVHRRLAEAEKASARAQELTQQLLTFSRGGAPVKETLSIGELVSETVGFTLRGSNVRCDVEFPDDLRPVDVDEGQMSRVIGNLALNAAQAMSQGGVLSIRCENVVEEDEQSSNGGESVRISFRDHGEGMPQEQLTKIFDPYFTTKKEGSGLGLTSVYSIVQKHGGRITVESEVGSGSVFRIVLPASEGSVRGTPERELEQPIAGARILVMDDEEMVREVAEGMLEALGGEVALAADGAEAVRIYRESRERGRPIDLVIMDLTVPGGMGGQEALERLMALDPDVCAVVSSGYSNAPVLANFRDHGFRGAVVKPYTIEELSEALAVALETDED